MLITEISSIVEWVKNYVTSLELSKVNVYRALYQHVLNMLSTYIYITSTNVFISNENRY